MSYDGFGQGPVLQWNATNLSEFNEQKRDTAGHYSSEERFDDRRAQGVSLEQHVGEWADEGNDDSAAPKPEQTSGVEPSSVSIDECWIACPRRSSPPPLAAPHLRNFTKAHSPRKAKSAKRPCPDSEFADEGGGGSAGGAPRPRSARISLLKDQHLASTAAEAAAEVAAKGSTGLRYKCVCIYIYICMYIYIYIYI